MATIVANPHFDVEHACVELNHAMKGVGTNEKKLIDVLTGHNNAQRQSIKLKYKQMFNKELKDHIRSEVSGNFQEGLVNLLYTPAEYYARSLNTAIGIIDRPHYIIEILTTTNDIQLREIEEAFRNKYKMELDQDLQRHEHFSIGSLYRALARATRPEDNHVDDNQAIKDAQALYEAGEAHFGTDSGPFIDILCTRSYAQLRLTFEEYARVSGKDITAAIKSETSGQFEDALVAIVECVRDTPKFLAEQFHYDVEGLGTKDSSMIRVLITRSEIDLENIKTRYHQIYHQHMYSRIKHETSHHYEDLCRAICKK